MFNITFTVCGDGGSDASVRDAATDAPEDSATDGSPEDASATDGSVADASLQDASASDGSASDGSASDAGLADGSVDASVPACFASCAEACQALVPSSVASANDVFCITQDGGADGVFTASCEAHTVCPGGRKFDGLAEPRTEAWLARAAWLEAASVHAFDRLARELEAHGAPRALVRRARACARDEVRHARMMTKLATARGVTVPVVQRPALTVRDLESIARENAIEGCVGETYGALYAFWRARDDRDRDIAAAMAAIAPDELRHAALGWAVAEWIDTKLDDAARARVRAARKAAAEAIVADARSPKERALATGLMNQLWADAA